MQFSVFTTRSRTLRALAAIPLMAVAAVWSQPVKAAPQQLFTDAFSRTYAHRHMRVMVEELNLDSDQRVLVETFMDEYIHAFDEGMDKMKADLQTAIENRASDDQNEVMELIFKPIGDWLERQAELDSILLNNVRSQLTPDQAQMWPGFERKLTRLIELGDRDKSSLSLEHIDLVIELGKIALNDQDRAMIAEFLRQYEEDMHAELVKRRNGMSQLRDEAFLLLPQSGSEKSLQLLEREIAFRANVQSVNDQYLTLFASLLSEEAGQQLISNVYEATFARIFRPTQAQRAFEAALLLEDLDPDVLQAIEQLYGQFLQALQTINMELMQLTREYEPVKMRYEVERQIAKAKKERVQRPENPTRPKFRERDQLERQYMEQLQDLLTPEQFASLPGAQRYIRQQPEGVTVDAENRSLRGEYLDGVRRREGSGRSGSNNQHVNPPTSTGNGKQIQQNQGGGSHED